MQRNELGTNIRPTDLATAMTRHGRHFARYLFAAPHATGKQVLDIACGGGYGSAYLASSARHVWGMELDDETLAQARRAFSASNLSFRRHDLHDPIGDAGPFDLIVCFETLEHVRDPRRCLDTLADCLAPGGMVIISVPNGDKEVRDRAEKPYHKRHFAAGQFIALLETRFSRMELFSQVYHRGLAHYWRRLTGDRSHPATAYRFQPGLSDSAKTWLAVARDPTPPGNPPARAHQ